jgi:hypothetical protein
MGRYLRAIVVSILLSAALLYWLRPIPARYEARASSSFTPQLSPGAELGTGFTYQGQLKKDGAAVTADCDFNFSLWDAAGSGSPPSGGNQIGGVDTVNAVHVSNGLFTVTINSTGQFGADAFTGEARWLQTSVTCPGDSGASTLSPRQPITPAPYALAAPGSAYRNVVIVAKSGGDTASIQAALDSILDAGPDNPYLVWVAPGVYTERVTMIPYVDIEGAGQLATKITFTGSGANTTGTVVTASNAELRSLTVENTGGAAYAIAVYNNATSPRLTDITAAASGDNNISAAVFNTAAASPTIRNAILMTSGAGFNHYTLYSVSSSTPSVRDSTIMAAGGATINYGVVSTVSSTTNIQSSMIGGTTSAVHMLSSAGRIASSQLVGGATTGGTGTLVCVGAYNQSFVALNAACQ